MGKKKNKPLELDWSERHKNGATIALVGEAARVASVIADWRAYQEKVDGTKRTAGFNNG